MVVKCALHKELRNIVSDVRRAIHIPAQRGERETEENEEGEQAFQISRAQGEIFLALKRASRQIFRLKTIQHKTFL